MDQLEDRIEPAEQAQESKEDRRWWAQGLKRPDGFGARTPGTWPSKWRLKGTATLRMPKELHEAILDLAHQADQQEDPVAWLMSLRPAQQPAASGGEWDRYNVAQLRQIARDRGLKTARAANRAQLLDFLNQEKKGV